jgi:hypothetical protein
MIALEITEDGLSDAVCTRDAHMQCGLECGLATDEPYMRCHHEIFCIHFDSQ